MQPFLIFFGILGFLLMVRFLNALQDNLLSGFLVLVLRVVQRIRGGKRRNNG